MSPAKILIVEDEAPARISIKHFLEDRNYDVYEAADGEKALQLLKRERYEALLLDLTLPKVSGFEVLKKVKADNPETTVIVVSGTGIVDDVVQSLHLGADDFVLKPIEKMDILLYALERALERRELHIAQLRYQELLESNVKDRTKLLAETNEKLKASEKRYRQLVYRMNEGLGVIDENMELVFVNPKLKEMFGLNADDELGSETCDNNELLQKLVEELKKCSEKEQESYELEWIKSDGSKLNTIVSPQVILGEDGVFKGSFAVITDITQYRDVESKRIELEKQLFQTQKMEALGVLAGGVAHDFNNILTSMLGYSEIALKAAASESKIKECVQQVILAGKRAQDLTRKILSFSRQSDTKPAPIDLSEILEEVLDLLKNTFPPNIEINFNCNVENPITCADATELHQIFMNLATNAMFAMQPDGGSLTVKITKPDLALLNKSEDKSYLLCEVSDTGCGIKQDDLPKIFDPFFTTKGLQEGTGMGLSVVHGIVEHYGGTINVASACGKGTTFSLYLPHIELNPTEIEHSPQALESTETGSSLILFVDDEEPLALLGKEMLEELGYDVIACSNPDNALPLFKEHKESIRAVITDQQMPGISGEELCSAIRELDSSVALILCSGFNLKPGDKSEKCFTAFLSKPYSWKDLANTLKEVL